MSTSDEKRARTGGFFLLAVFLPLGLTLEALHAMKIAVYFGSTLRRELWTLAHAHGNLLGLLNLVWALVAERTVPDPKRRALLTTLIVWGSWAMPLGFFFGGILNREGDPSLGILLTPIGGCALLAALLGAAFSSRRSAP